MIHILHLEDDPVDSQFVADLLQAEGMAAQIQRVHTLAAFNEGLGIASLDLILSDYTIPGMNALDALRSAHQLRPEVPLIFLSGTIGEERAIETLKQGATDYILKDHNSKLVSAIRRALQETEERNRRKAGEHQLARTTARFNGIISSAMDAIISIDQHQEIVLFNPAAEKMFGMDSAHACGRNINEFIPERFRAAHTQHVTEFGSTGVSSRSMSYLGSLSGLRSNGEEFPIEATISQTEVGEEKLYTVILRDVTDRKRAEEALRQREELLRTMVDAMPQLAWIAHGDGHIFWYNQQWFDYTGTTPAQMEGWGWQSVHDPAVLPDVLRQWKESIATGSPLEMVFPLRGKDGRFRPFLTRVMPLKDAQGRVTQWFGTNTDIAAQKDFEAKLEHLVKVRTAKLEEAIGDLKHFSYTITHDMRAPLRAMRGFADIILHSANSDEGTQKLLRRITSSAERMDRLITDALSYSRLAAEEMELVPIDVMGLLADIVDSYPNLAPYKEQIRIADDIPLVLGSQAPLTQCFSNLLNNAVKFTQPGKLPEIRIWAEPRDHMVRIWVEDNGIGIAPDMIPKVFDMFSRANQSYEGTGIGLALVRKVVDRMNGKVGVDSHLNHGSRFWVELQRAGQPTP